MVSEAHARYLASGSAKRSSAISSSQTQKSVVVRQPPTISTVTRKPSYQGLTPTEYSQALRKFEIKKPTTQRSEKVPREQEISKEQPTTPISQETLRSLGITRGFKPESVTQKEMQRLEGVGERIKKYETDSTSFETTKTEYDKKKVFLTQQISTFEKDNEMYKKNQAQAEAQGITYENLMSSQKKIGQDIKNLQKDADVLNIRQAQLGFRGEEINLDVGKIEDISKAAISKNLVSQQKYSEAKKKIEGFQQRDEAIKSKYFKDDKLIDKWYVPNYGGAVSSVITAGQGVGKWAASVPAFAIDAGARMLGKETKLYEKTESIPVWEGEGAGYFKEAGQLSKDYEKFIEVNPEFAPPPKTLTPEEIKERDRFKTPSELVELPERTSLQKLKSKVSETTARTLSGGWASGIGELSEGTGLTGRLEYAKKHPIETGLDVLGTGLLVGGLITPIPGDELAGITLRSASATSKASKLTKVTQLTKYGKLRQNLGWGWEGTKAFSKWQVIGKGVKFGSVDLPQKLAGGEYATESFDEQTKSARKKSREAIEPWMGIKPLKPIQQFIGEAIPTTQSRSGAIATGAVILGAGTKLKFNFLKLMGGTILAGGAAGVQFGDTEAYESALPESVRDKGMLLKTVRDVGQTGMIVGISTQSELLGRKLSSQKYLADPIIDATTGIPKKWGERLFPWRSDKKSAFYQAYEKSGQSLYIAGGFEGGSLYQSYKSFEDEPTTPLGYAFSTLGGGVSARYLGGEVAALSVAKPTKFKVKFNLDGKVQTKTMDATELSQINKKNIISTKQLSSKGDKLLNVLYSVDPAESLGDVTASTLLSKSRKPQLETFFQFKGKPTKVYTTTDFVMPKAPTKKETVKAGKGKQKPFTDFSDVSKTETKPEISESSKLQISSKNFPVVSRSDQFLTAPTTQEAVLRKNVPVVVQTPVTTRVDITTPSQSRSQQQTPTFQPSIIEPTLAPISVPISSPELVQTPTDVPVDVPVGVPVSVPVPVPTSQFPFIPFGFGDFGSKGKTKGKRASLRTRYTPSFDALVLGIYADKPAKTFFSGQETRAIIGTKKRQKTTKLMEKINWNFGFAQNTNTLRKKKKWTW